ncbi:MAG TPA: 50S ribosomal protein L6 [Planctomycetota bacterium]|nr:50S ribosomal protein L6 [Planctomycetota bacterium]OQC19576.1 MAG: 50S ribosomal protein L6 [Planctomycetes bacterium ADurb.Bin069]NMD36607.1 50S ribosomal protein L6 [Planctomycetota bacterium]HNR98987.1 50S ribosomal protein L6 [Planctomycetota bacterium]HNU27014.1 50S ribosomal protein L6 [Planctomycetota bacterium]
MSRIGIRPVALPPGVKAAVKGGELIAEGPKGKMAVPFGGAIACAVKNGKEITVSRAAEDARSRAMHGTVRALVANAVQGVAEGWTKVLQVWGVGFVAEVKGGAVVLSLGYSHKIEFKIPKGVEVKAERVSVEGTNIYKISVTGPDRAVVGQLAADIRAARPPEPYKGTGIRYEGERIVRKAGKSFQSGGAGG